METTPGLAWPSRMRSLLSELQHRRNTDLAKGVGKMPERERKKVGERYDEILRTGCREYRELCPSLFERLMLSASGRLSDCAQAYSLDFEEMRSRKGEMPDDGLGEDDCKSLQKDINTLIRLMAGKEHCLLFLSDYSIPRTIMTVKKAQGTSKCMQSQMGGCAARNMSATMLTRPVSWKRNT